MPTAPVKDALASPGLNGWTITAYTDTNGNGASVTTADHLAATATTATGQLGRRLVRAHAYRAKYVV